MSIRYDSRNKRWRFEFDRYVENRRQRASRLLPKGWTQAQAHAFDLKESARLHAIAAGIERPEPLIEDAVLLYLKHKAPELKSEANIVRELKAFFDVYRGLPFSALPGISRDYRPVHVEGPKKGSPLAMATVRNRLAYLRAACRYGWKHHGMGEHDPAERMQMPKVNNERHVYLDRRQFLEICRQVPPGGKRAAIRIAFYSGMRAAEPGACDLAADGQAFILDLADTKNGQPRMVPVHPRIAHITRNPALWPIRPTKWTVSIAFKTAAVAAGYGHARLHDLRHSTASEMINAGVDLFTVGGVLGHRSAVSTRRYSHLQTATLAAALGTVGKKSRTPQKKKAA